MNPRMWAHPATRANAETLRRARRRARRPGRGRDGRGRVGRGADGRAGRDRAPRRAAARARPLAGQARRSSPPAARASRSTPRASSATAPPAAWASRSPRRRGGAGPRSSCSRRTSPSPAPHGVETIPTPTAEAMLDAALALADFDIALLAAAVADYRPAEALAGKRAEERRGLDARARADRRHRPRARRGASAPGQVLVTFGAELGEEGLERKRAHARDEERRPRRLQRRLARRHRLRERRERGRARDARRRPARARRRSKAAIAAAILDEVERLLGRMS